MERPAVDQMTKESFYNDAKDYWKEIPATVDGMLGGFGQISGEDINGSLEFLKPFLTVCFYTFWMTDFVFACQIFLPEFLLMAHLKSRSVM